jgi:SAM-dependent methyltransferase
VARAFSERSRARDCERIGAARRSISRASRARGVTGIDVNANGVATANAHATGTRVRFERADATSRLPFEAATFDALLCVDAMNHLPNRADVLAEWKRVLKPAGRALWTDPVVITGPVTKDELDARASIGSFLFVPDGVNERLLSTAGFELEAREDASEAAASMAAPLARRARDRSRIPGRHGRRGGIRGVAVVSRCRGAPHREGKLSRFVYLCHV